jgi:chorismate mutase/prephenate dehydratase
MAPDSSDTPTKISDWRERIDAIDDQVLELLNERARCNSQIGKLKAASEDTGAAVIVPARELEIFERLEAGNTGPFPSGAIRSVFREIISASVSLQQEVGVAFLGPQGTFTHQAALQQFGQMARFEPAMTTSDIFRQVETDHVDFGVVPVENSNEGIVSHTLDLFVESPLTISAEIHVPIHHDLLSVSGDLSKIEAVHSHPQPLAQCRHWLELNLPNTPQHTTHSTAQSAERARLDGSIAAIASPVCADMYSLKVVRSGIQDNRENTTRFLVISKSAAKPSQRDVTSLLFSIKRDQVGALYHALEPFQRHGVNLTRIESRPTRSRAWEYVFFADFEGHRDDPEVAAALSELTPNCDFVKVLGSYPRAKLQ